MKIAVSSAGKELTSDLDPRFGRATCFLVVDTDSMAFEVVENVQNLGLAQGAGIQAALTVADAKVAALLTGHCGPKAFQVLRAAGIEVITGARGRVSDAVRRYLDGELKPASGANVEGHWI